MTVAVKNQGSGPAASFVVQVVVDDEGDKAKKKSGLSVDGVKELRKPPLVSSIAPAD